LAGSPTGWTVTLSGAYTANATVDNSSFDPEVTVAYIASVKAAPSIVSQSLVPGLRYFRRINTSASDPNSLSVPVTNFTPTSAILGNGTYWVFGQASVTGSIEGSAINIFRSGAANGSIAGSVM